MSIALLIKADPRVPGYERQILIMPTPDSSKSEPAYFTRTTDGTRGRNNKWVAMKDMHDVVSKITPLEIVTSVWAVGVTARNARDIAANDGFSNAVATRLLDKDLKNDPHGYRHAQDAVKELTDRLVRGDQALMGMVQGGVHGPISHHLQVLPSDSDSDDQEGVLAEAAKIVDAAALSVNDDTKGAVKVETKTAPVHDKTYTSMVPPMAVAKEYQHRVLAGGVPDFDLLDYAHKNRRNVLLAGPTGPGKTMVARAWAATNRRAFVRVQGNGALDPVPLFGREVVRETSDGSFATEWVDGMLTFVVRNGGVLCLDEINFIPPKIATVLFSLLDAERTIRLMDNHGEVVQAHPDLLIVATMNPNYAGTTDLNAALKNRFPIQVAWGYDAAVEKKLGIKPVIAALAKSIRQKEAEDAIQTPTPTNALVDFQTFARELGLEYAISNFLARYEDDERAAVEMLINTKLSEIKQALGISS